MTGRLRVGVVFAAVSAWSVLVVAPVMGAAPVAVCHHEARMAANEGFWFSKATSTEIRSVAGSIVCAGFVNGREVLAEPVPMTQMFTTRPGSTCARGTGTGSWAFVLLLADGTRLPVSGSQEGGWWTPTFYLSGMFNNQGVRGGGVVRPDPEYPHEDCITEPLRHWFDFGTLIVGP